MLSLQEILDNCVHRNRMHCTAINALHGAFLWRQVDVVVELKQNWRAKDDEAFIEMLNRIRLGKVRKIALDDDHPTDYNTLKARILSQLKITSPTQFDEFKEAPCLNNVDCGSCNHLILMIHWEGCRLFLECRL